MSKLIKYSVIFAILILMLVMALVVTDNPEAHAAAKLFFVYFAVGTAVVMTPSARKH